MTATPPAPSTTATGPVHEAAPALRVSGLHKQFGGVAAVQELDLEVAPGSVFGLLGPNGAGKTTVLNLVSGFLTPDRGRLEVHGEDATGRSSHEIARMGVARTYQNVRLFEGMSVLDTVVAGFYQHRTSTFFDSVLALGRERRERREFRERALELLDRVGVNAHPEQIGTTLPYGDQRRLELARALATNPRLLLLDEPTAGMNATESSSLGDLLHQLRDDGVTLVLIEHNMRLVMEYCESAAVIHFGQLLATGTPRECVAQRDVQEAYFGKRSDAERVETLLKLRRDPGGQ